MEKESSRRKVWAACSRSHLCLFGGPAPFRSSHPRNTKSDFFTIGKGLRQGEPLSPLRFNILLDSITRMLSGLTSLRGFVMLFSLEASPAFKYADDTIMFVDYDQYKANNRKNVLNCFENVYSMWVNYDKSELI